MRKITKADLPAPKSRGNSTYDWDAMLGDLSVGDIVAFDKGTDFNCLATSFAVQARDKAAERGLSLHIPALDKDSTTVAVEVRAPKADDEDEAPAAAEASVESDES